MRFCDKLAKQRKNNNLSQELLADKLGVSRQAVSKWESGSTYPDMEKMIQMCKILDCTLEDLMDDGVISGEVKKEQKFNFNQCIEDFLSFITKTVNMFSSMSIKEKTKCLMEMFVVFIVLLCTTYIAFTILANVTNNLIYLLPAILSRILSTIINTLYTLIMVVIGVICFIHIFKIRYLDYFITIEDDSVVEKTIEEEVDKTKKVKKEENSSTRERIIIRDPKHTSFSFISFLGKIVLFIVKLFVGLFTIPAVILFLLFVFLGVISLVHINYGIIFFFIALIFISIVVLIYVALYFAYQFIFNRKINFKIMFILVISGLVMLAAASGITFVIGLNYKYIENPTLKLDNVYEEEITIDDKTHFSFDEEANFEYIIDNSRSNALVQVYSYGDFDYRLLEHSYEDEGIRYYSVVLIETNYYDAYKLLLRDIKNKEIRSYTYDNLCQVKVYLNETDYQKLMTSYDE